MSENLQNGNSNDNLQNGILDNDNLQNVNLDQLSNDNFKDDNKIIVYKYIILKTPTQLIDVLPFVLFFSLYCLIIYTLMLVIKKISKNFHSILLMSLIILFPPLTMFLLEDFLFLFIWFLLIGFFIYCLRIGFSKGLLANKNPKLIYKIFKKIFTWSTFMILISQLLVLFSTFLFSNLLKWSIRFLFYSLYFAVFCREVMFNLSRIMAKTTGFYSSALVNNQIEDFSKCMICNETLITGNKIFTNTCGHSFHNECIKGWCLLGNNSFCIYCKKGIEDYNKLNKDLWYKTENMVRPLMNLLRSSISFFVVLYLYMLCRLK